jgi:glycosyltransferase involved in cell wall biosynthesis
MLFLLYLAKPTYGGWVSFTSHLSLKNSIPLYKISKRSENKCRNYGYNVNYKNINLDSLDNMIETGDIPIITAVDKNFYSVLDHIPDNSYIIIHDPTEFNKSSKKVVIDNLKRLQVITIRKSVHDLLLSMNIPSKLIIHPYVSMISRNIGENIRTGAISISRIDYDKNIDIIVKANSLVPNKENKVEIFGEPNERYIYQKLLTWDNFKKDDINSQYRGHFPKTFEKLSEILINKRFVVDMSSISQDGGGTQYTFLEAIDAGCVLILNSKWTNNLNSIWQHNHNCLVVSNSDELAEILNATFNYDIDRIYKNSISILKDAESVNWNLNSV